MSTYQAEQGQRLLALCMFLTIGAWGFLQPLASLYLEAAGLTSWQIGVVTGAGTGIAFLLQPLWGRLSDKFDIRRPFMLGSALAAGIAYLCFRYARSPLHFALLTALGTNAILYMNAAAGVLSSRLAQEHERGKVYARVRLWGSVGYVIVAVSMGVAMQRFSGGTLSREQLETAFTFGPMLFFALALATLFAPDPKFHKQDNAPQAKLHLSTHIRWFLLAFFLWHFAFNGMLAYLSLYLKQLGAQPLQITGVWASGVVCEILMMSQSGKLSDRFGRRPLLFLPFLVLPLRIFLLIPATTPLWIFPVQMTEFFCFGVIGAVAVAFVNDLTPPQTRGAAQGLLFGIVGLTMALAPLTAGALIEVFHIRAMFGIMAAISVLAALVFLFCVVESHSMEK